MLSEYTTSFVGGTYQARAVSATSAPMTAAVAMMRDDSDAVERWRAWSARGAKTDRQAARTMNRVFVALVLALSAWLVFQLLS
jgi:hypothetical protein